MPDDPSASTSPADSFEQRMRFGSYEILRTDDGKQLLLGKGAFGRTYKARHVFLERTVALKIINDKFLADAKARERFLGEARAAAKLSHPHIAQILDFGETDGILYYAMEYCSGGDLADYVKRNGPLSVVQAVQIGLQVAGALQCAHAAGFIHRDLKPSNLMMASPDGPIVTKLIDFGLVIAKPAEDQPQIDPDDMPTIEQRFIGTPLFASPEQLLVQPLDARSDFFSLGMTLWFLVLGAPPDPGNSAAIVAARLKADSYAPRLPRKLPQSFQAVLARLLEKRPENRFANSTQLVAAFGKCAAGLGLPTAPSSSFALGAEEGEEDAGPIEPAAIEKIEAPVEECFTVQGQRGGNATGADFEATSLTDQSTVWLHFLKPVVAGHEKTMVRVRKNVGFLQRRNVAGVIHVAALRAHPDRTLVVMEAPGGGDLLAASKAAGPLRLADARPLFQAIATACDTLLAAGLPAPELDPHRVFLRQPSETAATVLAGAEPRLLPQFLTRAEVAAIEGAPPVADEPGWHYAALIYRLLSARNLPNKPALTPEDCLAVPGLSEEGHRLLSHALARQLVHATCSELLADLLIAEGLMGVSVTRTHATASPTTTHGATVTATAEPPVLTTHGQDSQLTVAPSSPETTRHLLVTPAPFPATAPPPPLPVAPHRERSAWPIIVGALLLLLALVAGGAWFVWKSHPELFAFRQTTPGATPSVSVSGNVRLSGELPRHVTARLGDQKVRLQPEGAGWLVDFEGASIPLPATLVLEATGFAPQKIEIGTPADLERVHEARLQRAEGILKFTNLAGADYVHASFKMLAQLPEEKAFVEQERITRGAEFSGSGEEKLPTGVYQLVLQGANPRIVRPRIISPIIIKAGETTVFTLPPPMAGVYTGDMAPQRNGKPDGQPFHVEVTIEPDLTGAYLEPSKRGPRHLTLDEGRIDSDGVFVGRIQFSLATDGEPSFDQLLTMRRNEDGTFDSDLSEAPDENPALERRLNRQPYAKSAFSARGTLRPKRVADEPATSGLVAKLVVRIIQL